MKIASLILSFIIFSLSGSYAYDQSPVAVRGVLDLRQTSIDEDFSVKLNGE